MVDRDPLLWGIRIRGLLLGLALGDSLGGAHGHFPATGVIRAGVSTQLATFTTEGIIRAEMRAAHKGICHPPSVVWHAYCRWAVAQGIEIEAMRRHWSIGAEQSWPDGWLAQVPLLGQRRGSAPATVAALKRLQPGTVENATSGSRGCHALTKTLPVAAVSYTGDHSFVADFAREVAALTHGHPDAHTATAVAVNVTAHCLTAESFSRAIDDCFADSGLEYATGWMMALDQAQQAGAKYPRNAGWLARLAPDATAPSALLGGAYVSMSFPDRGNAMDALRFAAGAPDGDSVAAVTGAFLGALHGADVWPVDLLSRLELMWVLDTLARDLVLQLTEGPGGAEYTPPRDPHWWDRYPGW